MPQTDPSELIKKIRSGELSKVYYIYGKDVMTVESVTKAVFKKRLGKEWRESCERFDGKELDINELTDSIEICPMFAEHKGVLVNDLNAEDLSADKLNQLTDTIQNIPDFTTLVINITGFDVKNDKKALSGKNKKLADCIMKSGVVCECAVKTAAVLEKSVIDGAKKRGLDISRQNAARLCEYCLMDSMLISNELEKLCAYRESGEITGNDIELLVSGQTETDAFRLAKAVISMDAAKSFYLLDVLLEKRNEPVAVISAISMSFLDLYRSKTALMFNKRPEDVVTDFGYGGRAFAVNNAFRDCRRISAENLRRCMSILRDADRTLKSSPVSPKTVLEKAVTEMIAAVRNAG